MENLNLTCVGCGLEGYKVEARLATALAYEAAVIFGEEESEDQGLARYVFLCPVVQSHLRAGEHFSAIMAAGSLAQQLVNNPSLTLWELVEDTTDEDEWKAFEEDLSCQEPDIDYLEDIVCSECGEEWDNLVRQMVKGMIYDAAWRYGGFSCQVAQYVADCPQVQYWLDADHFANALVCAVAVAEKLDNREDLVGPAAEANNGVGGVGGDDWVWDDDAREQIEDDDRRWDDKGEGPVWNLLPDLGAISRPAPPSSPDGEDASDVSICLEDDEAWREYLLLQSIMEDDGLGTDAQE